MKAIVIRQPGGPECLEYATWPRPELKPGEARIRVRATALNGADLLQRRGLYPPPAGESPLLGLEVSGEVLEVAAGASSALTKGASPALAVGARVMALLSGGGYAEEVAVPAGLCLPIPGKLSFEEAAAIPEVFFTAYLELVKLAELKRGEWLLIHAGASGVGTAAIQLGREWGAHVIATAGSAAKCESCLKLGAEVAVNYKSEDFAARVAQATGGRGVDCILDLVGASHWASNIQALAVGGRLLLVGLGGGSKVEVDLRALLAKRARVIASTLRARPLQEKLDLARGFQTDLLPLFEAGRLRPIVDRVFPLAQAADAHRYLESASAVGKIVLRVD